MEKYPGRTRPVPCKSSIWLPSLREAAIRMPNWAIKQRLQTGAVGCGSGQWTCRALCYPDRFPDRSACCVHGVEQLTENFVAAGDGDEDGDCLIDAVDVGQASHSSIGAIGDSQSAGGYRSAGGAGGGKEAPRCGSRLPPASLKIISKRNHAAPPECGRLVLRLSLLLLALN